RAVDAAAIAHREDPSDHADGVEGDAKDVATAARDAAVDAKDAATETKRMRSAAIAAALRTARLAALREWRKRRTRDGIATRDRRARA
ncbi:MAG: hypothetical protein ACREX6_06905, partial [Casimicrobiaceae bacterium]